MFFPEFIDESLIGVMTFNIPGNYNYYPFIEQRGGSYGLTVIDQDANNLLLKTSGISRLALFWRNKRNATMGTSILWLIANSCSSLLRSGRDVFNCDFTNLGCHSDVHSIPAFRMMIDQHARIIFLYPRMFL